MFTIIDIGDASSQSLSLSLLFNQWGIQHPCSKSNLKPYIFVYDPNIKVLRINIILSKFYKWEEKIIIICIIK